MIIDRLYVVTIWFIGPCRPALSAAAVSLCSSVFFLRISRTAGLTGGHTNGGAAIVVFGGLCAR